MDWRRPAAWIHPRFAVVVHDLAMAWIAWTVVNLVRWSFQPDAPDLTPFGIEAGLVVLAQGAVFRLTGLYRGLWRFASLPDLWNIVRAAVLGALSIAIALFLYNRLATVPRTALVVYPVMLVVLLGAPRLAWRYWKDSRLDFLARAPGQRVLVLGAGKAGEALVRDLRREGRYAPVGFLDDDPHLRGARVHGVPVLGTLAQLPRLARETAAEMVVIAIPAANSEQMRRIVDLCEASKLPVRTVPRLEDVVAGRSGFNELKEVAIEDLLGREPVRLDWTAIRTCIAGKRVVVTGGGGSIGSELCRQIARLGAEALTILEVSEHNLYQIDAELRREFADLLVDARLCDACDAAAVERAFAQARPHIVFHAAAYKHVPLLQGQLREAFRNNVLGTAVVAEAAARHAADAMVLISTDKAVNPASVMGACKRIAELYCQNFPGRADTRFITVRFGNVLDSAGSVVPLFRRQIRAGGPVTVTHPEVTRYFMTIPESCQLILQAAVLGHGGEVFVLDMGEPIRIRYLAEQMIRLAGKSPDDVAIVYTGLRPGEKLFEELFHPLEQCQVTSHPKIRLAEHGDGSWTEIEARLREAEAAVREFDEERLARLVAQWLPGFAAPRASAPGEGADVIPIGSRGTAGAAS